MLSKVLVFSGLLAIVLSVPISSKALNHLQQQQQQQQQQPEPVAIVSQDSNAEPDGKFHWSYESADGTKQEQNGDVKQINEKEISVAVQGQVSWTDNEGKPHQLTYVADETGYHPQSEDVPQAPEIPKEIARSLEYNAAHPQPEEQQNN